MEQVEPVRDQVVSFVAVSSGLTEAIKTTGDTYDAIGKLFEEQASLFVPILQGKRLTWFDCSLAMTLTR